MKNKTVNELAYEFSEQFLDATDENSNYEAQACLIGFLAGFSARKEIEQRILTDTLNKYRSWLAEEQIPKLDKTANFEITTSYKAYIHILEELKNKLK